MAGEPARGELRLISDARPALEAGAYELKMSQQVTAGGQSVGAIDDVVRHAEVTAPRFNLPAGDVHSVFPPPNAVGAFDNRLAQIALRRRTLPWERRADNGTMNPSVPWLALVILADGEAKFLSGVAIADALPAAVANALGVTETGTCDALEVSGTVVKNAFPYREEVPLLCHVRQVNLLDSEFAGTDDDGFLSVVVCNRLPRPGRRYGAYLLSLEGQLDALPARGNATPSDNVGGETVYAATQAQLQAASLSTLSGAAVQLTATAQPTFGTAAKIATASPWNQVSLAPPAVEPAGAIPVASVNQAFLAHDVDFATLHAELGQPPPVLHRFPVLRHWSFTCAEGGDFQTLMAGLDVGLLGTRRGTRGRPEGATHSLADTGHTVIDAVSRRGDPVRAWYRGPFTPRQVVRRPAGSPYRAADQLRRVADDGREDISLAAAFELGRLLALSDQRFLTVLQTWRRDAVARRRLAAAIAGSEAIPLDPDATSTAHVLGIRLATSIATGVAPGTPVPDEPEPALGEPVRRSDVEPLLGSDAEDARTIADGLGVSAELVADVLSPGLTETALEPERFTPELITDFDELVAHKQDLDPLQRRLAAAVQRIAAEALVTGTVRRGAVASSGTEPRDESNHDVVELLWPGLRKRLAGSSEEEHR